MRASTSTTIFSRFLGDGETRHRGAVTTSEAGIEGLMRLHGVVRAASLDGDAADRQDRGVDCGLQIGVRAAVARE